MESLNNTINNTPQYRHDTAPSISISITVWWSYVLTVEHKPKTTPNIIVYNMAGNLACVLISQSYLDLMLMYDV